MHQDLWVKLWSSWQLLGESVSVQWVPSPAGLQGNEQADKCAQEGTAAALPQVREDRAALDVAGAGVGGNVIL